MIAYGRSGRKYFVSSEKPSPPFYVGVHIALIAICRFEFVKYLTYRTNNYIAAFEKNPLLKMLDHASEIFSTLSSCYPTLSYSNFVHSVADTVLAT